MATPPLPWDDERRRESKASGGCGVVGSKTVCALRASTHSEWQRGQGPKRCLSWPMAYDAPGGGI
eukprot:835297-Prymnesium_polylepis.1